MRKFLQPAMHALEGGVQRQADQAFASSTSVRALAYGTTRNLVGKDWNAAKEDQWTGAQSLRSALSAGRWAMQMSCRRGRP